MQQRRDIYEQKPYAGESVEIRRHLPAGGMPSTPNPLVIPCNRSNRGNGAPPAHVPRPRPRPAAVARVGVKGRGEARVCEEPTHVPWHPHPSDGYRSNGQFMSCLRGLTLQNDGHRPDGCRLRWARVLTVSCPLLFPLRDAANMSTCRLCSEMLLTRSTAVLYLENLSISSDSLSIERRCQDDRLTAGGDLGPTLYVRGAVL